MNAGRNSNFGANDVYGLSASRGPTPRPSNYDEDVSNNGKPRYHYPAPAPPPPAGTGHYPAPNPGMFSPTSAAKNAKKPNGQAQTQPKSDDPNKDLHMFVWSSSASPVSDVFGGAGGHEYAAGLHDHKEVKLTVSPGKGFFFF